MEKNKRIYYLDILRVIACLSVIIIHSSANDVIKDIGSLNFWTGNILNGLSRIAVPLFVMISGALMLDENYQFSFKKLIKHLKKMIIFFIFWSIIYCVIFDIIYPILYKNETIDIIYVISSLIEGYFHLWFIYLIIGLYLIVPLLRLWVNNKNKKYVEYFIMLSIIFTLIIPQIANIGKYYSSFFEIIYNIIEKNLSIKYVGGYTIYFILGWYINNYEIKAKKTIYILGIIGFLMTTIGTYIFSMTTGQPLQMNNNLSINVLFQTLAIFILVKNKFKEKQDNVLINSIAKYSLGIYAIHALFIKILYIFLEKNNITSALIKIPIAFTLSFGLSYLSTCILSKIPFLKKFI